MVSTKRPTKIPGFRGRLPANDANALREQVDLITEALNVRLGRVGDPLDRAPTMRELLSIGLVVEAPAGKFTPDTLDNSGVAPNTPSVNTTIPTAPSGVSTGSGYSVITVFWDFPTYSNHSQTEVWRGTTDVLGDALLIGVSGGRSYADYVGSGASYYYWVRHVSESNFVGPYNSGSGTLGTTSVNTSLLLADLTEAIGTSELTSGLLGTLNGYGASILTLDSSVSDLFGEYTLKINVNGHISGFGLASSPTSSAFTILADQFSVVSNDGGILSTPFVVVATPTTLNGEAVPAGVYISQAFIMNGSIENAMIGTAAIDDAKIANLSADKIDAGTLSTSRLNIDGATLVAGTDGALKIGVLEVDNLKADLIITEHIVGAAVNAVLTSDITVANTLPTTAAYEIVDSITFVKEISDSLMVVEFQLETTCTGAGNYALYVRIKRDGVVVSRLFAFFRTKSFAEISQGKAVLHGYPAGSAVYQLDVQANVSGAGVSTATVNNSTLIITEIKK